MATFTQLLGLQSGVQAVAQSGDTINFTGFTLTGFSTDSISDGTGTVDFGAAGALQTSGIASYDLNVTGAYTADVGSISLDATGASNLTVTGANLDFSTVTSGTLAIQSAGDLIAVGAGASTFGDTTGTWEFDGSGGLSSAAITTMALDSSDTTNLSMAANDAGAKTLTIGAANAGAGAANLDVNVKSDLTMDAGTFSLDATGTSNVTATGAALTVSTVTSGDLAMTGADAVNITAGAASTWGITGTLDLDASGALSINSSGGAINVGNDAVAQAISVGTGAAARTIKVGNTTGATAIGLDAGTGGIVGEVQDSQAAAFKVGISGDSKNVTLSTLNNALALTGVALSLQNTDGSSPIAQSYGGKAAGSYTQHHMLTIDATSGEFSTFDCDAGDNLMGTALLAAAAQNDPAVLGIGGVLNVVFDSAPAAASIGSIVYALGATGSNQGKVGLTAPTTSGARVWKVGILVAADGAATTTQIQWQPQFLYDVP
jgi:hypothetical protein